MRMIVLLRQLTKFFPPGMASEIFLDHVFRWFIFYFILNDFSRGIGDFQPSFKIQQMKFKDACEKQLSVNPLKKSLNRAFLGWVGKSLFTRCLRFEHSELLTLTAMGTWTSLSSSWSTTLSAPGRQKKNSVGPLKCG